MVVMGRLDGPTPFLNGFQGIGRPPFAASDPGATLHRTIPRRPYICKLSFSTCPTSCSAKILRCSALPYLRGPPHGPDESVPRGTRAVRLLTRGLIEACWQNELVERVEDKTKK